MPAAPQPSWRGSGGTPGRGGAGSWRRPASGSATTLPVRSLWMRRFLSLLSAMIAIAAITLFVMLVFVPGCTRTHYTVFSPAPYSDEGMPPQPFARQDSDAFRTRFKAENLPDRLTLVPGSAGAKASSRGGSSKSVLVVYVNALAGRNDNGIFLYPADAGPDETDSYLPLDLLWDFLKQLPSSQKKIVVLDIARGPVDWRWGQMVRPSLGSDAEQGSTTDEWMQIVSSIPNLAVLASGAPGEVSWSSPSFAQSAFAHFLMRALSGEADGNRDHRVTLREVHRYVYSQTNHWASQNRDLRGQHPQLLVSPESREPMLNTVVAEVRSSTESQEPRASKAAAGGWLRRLEDLWDARDKWSAKEPEQWHPIGWRRFTEHLHRAEQWWLAGQPDGMESHLDAAEKALADLQSRDAARSPNLSSFKFVSAGLSRGSSQRSLQETDPPLPETQLKTAFEGLAPEHLTKPPREAALRLRATTERLTWNSFRSRLWLGTMLADLDRDRRRAEDLLFVGGETELDESAKLRQSAEVKTEQIDQTLRDLMDALHLHHRLLAELPDLARWAAERLPVENLRSTATKSRRARLMLEYSQGIDEARFRPPSLADQAKLQDDLDDSSLQQTEIDLLLLFERTRQLAHLMDRELDSDEGSVFANGSEWRDELKTLHQSLTDPDHGLDALRGRLTRHAKGLAGAPGGAAETTAETEAGQYQYFHWLRLRNALQWSGLPAETRRALFADVDKSDQTLHANTSKPPDAAAAPWNGDDWSGIDGSWQSLWALQTLSLGLPETEMHKHWVVWKNAVVDEKKQINLLVQLGQEIRFELRQRVERAQPTPASTDSLEDVLQTLIRADRAGRTLHGYDAENMPLDRDPVRKLQDFDLRALCLAQADRYLEDFWGPVFPNDRESWYVRAVNQCLQVAGKSSDILPPAAVKTAVANLDRRLQARRTAKVRIAKQEASLDLSLKKQGSVHLEAELNDEVPPGVAALWLMEDQPASPESSLLEFRPAGRRALTAGALNAEFTIQRRRDPSAADCAEIPVRSRLLFRGHYWDTPDDVVRVNPCPPNSILWEYQPAATTGEIVVYGADRRDTIFILDCSFSMTEPIDPQNKNGDNRFQAARKALADALRVLRDSPSLRNEKEPHVVGLMAYGHRAKAKDGNPNATAVNPDWPLPIPAPVSADWRNDYEMLTAPSRLVDEHYQKMSKNLETLAPFGQTPLLGAILSAARSLIERKRAGVIVAICDGAYNDDLSNGPRFKSVEDLFQGHPELSLHLVAFGIDAKADIASLEKLTERTRGTFYKVPTGAKLAQTIETAMKPRPYSVVREAPPRDEVSAKLGEPIGDLAPQSYKVRFPNLRESLVAIRGGERLAFDIDFLNTRLNHRRPQPLLSRRAQTPSSLPTGEPNRFGYLKAEHDKAKSRAEFIFCLDRDDDLGFIERPAEIHIEIAPRGSRRQFSGSWQLAERQSIPAWQVILRDWPADAKPEVRAFWKPSRTEPDAQLSLPLLLKDSQTVTLPDRSDHPFTVTAEQKPGKVLIRLQAADKAGEIRVGDVRIELGGQSSVEGRFQPADFQWRAELFEKQRHVLYHIDVGDKFLPDRHHVAITSRTSLENGARTLESPLVIEKWDSEQ